MIRVAVRKQLAELLTDELHSLDVAFTDGWPGSQLETEHVYVVPQIEGSPLNYLMMTGTQVNYDDDFELMLVISTNVSGRGHGEALERCELIVNACLDATLRPFSVQKHERIHADVIDCLPTLLVGPISEERAEADGAFAFARLDVSIHTRSARIISDA